ncbi:MAG: carbohydrate kinase family protein [Candidatus Helarchaeota archaeon]
MKIFLFGHLCIDTIKKGNKTYPPSMGGTAAFSSIICSRLIAPDRVNLVSKIGGDFPEEFLTLLKEGNVDLRYIARVKQPSTRYLLEYFDDERRLTLQSICKPIMITDFPPESFEADLIYLGPIAREISPQTIKAVKNKAKGIVALDIQGILRHRNKDGSLFFKSDLEIEESLSYIDILKLDRGEAEIVTGASKLRDILTYLSHLGVRIALITKSRRGSALFYEGKIVKMPALLLRQFYDATGAGDCFFSAFLVEYLKDKDPFRAFQFARKAVSFLIGTPDGLRSFLQKGNIYQLIDDFLDKNQLTS